MNRPLISSNNYHDLITIRTASDCAVILYINDKLLGLDKSNAIIGLLTTELLANRPSWLREYIPSYTSLLIEFSLHDADHLAVNAFLKILINDAIAHIGEMINFKTDTENKQSDDEITIQALSENNPFSLHHEKIIHKIPVCYELQSLESDLLKVAKEKSLSINSLIELHCSVCYRVFATGFLPGFAYLGELPEEMSQARLDKPRTRVPKGAVAIADRQTAIYPAESPGGWHILGYTPIEMLLTGNDERRKPIDDSQEIQSSNKVKPLLKAGDYVEFYPITEEQYLHWRSS